MRTRMMASILMVAAAAALSAGCATSKPKPPPEPVAKKDALPPGAVSLLKYEQKTAELLKATAQLESLEDDIDAQRRRLATICADYPEHAVCDIHRAADYARAAFCDDNNFTSHIDEIVRACHEGACKQVDEAQLLSRGQYMTLIQRLPHKLLTFRSAETRLDRRDKKEIQQFIEAIGGEAGYIIIVGRASREGPWRDNLRYALDRAEATRRFIIEQLGMPADRVGFITYGHEKMYLTGLDAERLAQHKLSARQANRSALIFSYPCQTK